MQALQEASPSAAVYLSPNSTRIQEGIQWFSKGIWINFAINIFYHWCSENQSRNTKKILQLLLSEVDTQMWLNVHVLYNVLYKVSGIQVLERHRLWVQTLLQYFLLVHQFFNTLLLYLDSVAEYKLQLTVNITEVALWPQLQRILTWNLIFST